MLKKALFLLLITLLCGCTNRVSTTNDKGYIVYVEFPLGEVKTYEVTDYRKLSDNWINLDLKDGGTIKLSSDRIIIEKIR